MRWGAEILSAQPAVVAAAERLRAALLLLYADDDPIADPRAARSSSRARPPPTSPRAATSVTTTRSSTKWAGRRCSKTWPHGWANTCRCGRRVRRVGAGGLRLGRPVGTSRSHAYFTHQPVPGGRCPGVAGRIGGIDVEAVVPLAKPQRSPSGRGHRCGRGRRCGGAGRHRGRS